MNTQDRHALQATGSHPAPCARFCEAKAYEITIKTIEHDRNALLDEVLEYRGIRDRLARRDQAGNLPEDASIYIGLLENRLAENRAKLALIAAEAQAMQNKLRLCAEAMQANDPGNYAAIFGADEQATA